MACTTNETKEPITLNNEAISAEELEERLRSLKNGERIVETTPGSYVSLERMQG